MTQFSWPFPATENLNEILPEPLRSWLGATSTGTSGPNLEYDARFLALQQAAEGKPETQFSEAQPPEWTSVQQQAEILLSETRDIRILLLWLEATLHLNGVVSFAPAVMVLANWIESLWEDVHPALDPTDGDSFERLNALSLLSAQGAVYRAFREATVLKSAHFGDLCIRHFEYAFEWTEPTQSESLLSKSQILALINSEEINQSELAHTITQSLDSLTLLSDSLQSKVSPTERLDFSLIQKRLELIRQNLKTEEASIEQDSRPNLPNSSPVATIQNAPGITSRQQAMDCIDQVCEYLERNEPSNPAQLLLRRSKRLLNRDFVELVRELAPDALNDVARIFGIDPNEGTSSDY